MKHLVLGSSGQIGNTLVQYLRRHGEDVLEFDIERNKEEDLRRNSNTLLDTAMRQADFVYFLAFDVGGSRYLGKYQKTYDFLKNNTDIMANTFDVLRKYKKKFIFTSSQMSNMSYSSYGVLKALGEYYTETLGGLTVKFWNVFGYEADMEKAHVITDFILQARDRKEIRMLTDGTEERQFLYAEDCSACLHKLASMYDTLPRNKQYHITTFEWSSVGAVAGIIAKLYPGTRVIPGTSGDKVQKDARNEPDPHILNYWKPETSLAEGIARVAEMYS